MNMLVFEAVVFLCYFAALRWLWRQQKPVYLGAFFAGTLTYIFDWVWVGKSFFNARFNDELTMIPGMTIQDISYPIVLLPAWGLAFGLLSVLLVMSAPALQRRFGLLMTLALVWLIGGASMTLLEEVLVSGLGIYTYYQKPEFLLIGVPWSNIFLSGNLMVLCYLGLFWMQRWADLPETLPFGVSDERCWKGLVMGALPIWGAFVLVFILHLFWYGATDPWIESGRAF